MPFKYDLRDLCAAVKTNLLRLPLKKHQESAATYFDPGIMIFRLLEELREYLAQSEILLKPHLLGPIPVDGPKPSERDVLMPIS